jgi:hypothetical protein
VRALAHARISTRKELSVIIIPRALAECGINAYINKMIETFKERQARQAIEGTQAMIEYRAAAEATLENRGRLRDARLARASVIVLPVPGKKRKVAVQEATASSAVPS